VPRGRSDIANTALRIFLQELGNEYDLSRGFEPFTRRKHLGEVLEFFDGRCCYCGLPLELDPATALDHVVPLNQTALGLHAWGNIATSCGPCNATKHSKDWEAFLLIRSPDIAAALGDKIRDFQSHYRYEPKLSPELRLVASTLYEESGKLSMLLIELKIARAADIIGRLHVEPDLGVES
jgi:hypothetical protein